LQGNCEGGSRRDFVRYRLRPRDTQHMEKPDIGLQYDQIAPWWNAHHIGSDYGVPQLEKALGFAASAGKALDVGCGAGGRLVRAMQACGYAITGVDASAEMIKLARENHADQRFYHSDIRIWKTPEKFDFILAWDCLFHLPLAAQKPVLAKLCGLLAKGGIMAYTFGNATGEHSDIWREQTFHYSSIGIAENVSTLNENNVSLLHLELDQYPEKHVFAISKKA